MQTYFMVQQKHDSGCTRLEELVRKTGSVLEVNLDFAKVMVERHILSKLLAMMDSVAHLHDPRSGRKALSVLPARCQLFMLQYNTSCFTTPFTLFDIIKELDTFM